MTLLRLTLGVLFVYVFFENKCKGLYTPGGNAGLISGYIKNGHAPTIWTAVMQFTADHARITAPMQAATELSFGVLLLLGFLTRPVGLAACAFLTSLWVSELGTAWPWELLVPMIVVLSVSLGGAGRGLGIDGTLHARFQRAAGGNAIVRFLHAIT
ncbi:MAG: hypothetical protein NVS2B7_04790 [Herpetosiphon sp.]